MLLLSACSLLAGCSTLPDASYPPHFDSDFAARCVVPTDGRLRVPATSTRLVVRALQAAPEPRGEIISPDGARWLLYEAGTDVLVRTRIRFYGDGDGDQPAPTGTILLPDAVEWLDPR